MHGENEIIEENETASKSSIDDVVADVIADVSPPSPIADMPEAVNGNADRTAPLTASPMPESVTVAPAAPKRGRGRPRKEGGLHNANPSAATSRPKIDGVKSTVSPAINPDTAAIEPCAEMCVMMVNTSGMMLGGELAAMTKEEIALSKSGFVSYFRAKGVNNVPPWVVLAGSLTPYYLRILTTTPAKTTVSTVVGRAWFAIKEKWKARKNARSYSRHNPKRENDTRTETSEASV